MWKGIVAGLMVAYLALLIDLTLFRYQVGHADRNLVPFRTIRHDFRAGGEEFRVNILGNLAAFAPLGLLAPVLLGRRASAGRIASGSLAFSLFIESVQGFTGHRVADVDDLILNTLGGLIGYGIWRGGRRLFRLRDSSS